MYVLRKLGAPPDGLAQQSGSFSVPTVACAALVFSYRYGRRKASLIRGSPRSVPEVDMLGSAAPSARTRRLAGSMRAPSGNVDHLPSQPTGLSGGQGSVFGGRGPIPSGPHLGWSASAGKVVSGFDPRGENIAIGSQERTRRTAPTNVDRSGIARVT